MPAFHRALSSLPSWGPFLDAYAARPVRPREIHQGVHGRQLAAEYLQRFPKDRYQTEVETWRELQSGNIEFTMKRLREPIS